MKNKKVVIILDDDEGHRALVERILKNKPHFENLEIIITDNGDQALRILKQRRGNVDLIATDLIHNGIDGYELAILVKKDFAPTRVLICSSALSLRPECRQIADDVLEKPFKFERYVDKINNLLS